MIDLHCHSNVSDGQLSPRQVVELAHHNGCTLLALTDHDHTGGIAEARQAADALKLRLINGVEISTTWRGRTIHIVGLDFNIENDQLQTLLAQVRQGRQARLRAIATKLEKHNIFGAYEGALALATNPEMVSRTHIAEYLIQTGHVNKKQQAFNKYLGEGKPCAVKHEWASLADCIAAIKAAGGLAIVAHPMRYHLSATAKRNLLQEFKTLGGHGIEVHSGNCNKSDRLNYTLLANRFGLLASAGSDFHRLGDFSGGILGACPELPSNSQPVWTHFQTASTHPSH